VDLTMLGQRLYERLKDILQSGSLIKELGIVLSIKIDAGSKDGNAASRNVDVEQAIMFVEGTLGIRDWALEPLFMHIHGLFGQQHQLFKKIPIESLELKDFEILTKCLLLINAKHATAWNVIKQLVLQKLTFVQKELQFLDLIFTKHPKSQEAWFHRRWLIEHLKEDSGISRDHQKLFEIFQHEIAICARVCEIYPKNYMAWTYRHFITDQLGQMTSENADGDKEIYLLTELKTMKDWNERHVSDHAGFQHSQYILKKLERILQSPKSNALMEEEFEFTLDLIQRYPGHEALWSHLGFLIHHFKFESAKVEKLMEFTEDCASNSVVERFQDQRRGAWTFQLFCCYFYQKNATKNQNPKRDQHFKEISKSCLQNLQEHYSISPSLLNSVPF